VCGARSLGFRRPTALHGTGPARATVCRLLVKFYESADASGLPEMQRLAGTVSTWWPEILAAITTGVTNAGSEGVNRLIKTDARCTFGYRNPVNRVPLLAVVST
jgi:transposase